MNGNNKSLYHYKLHGIMLATHYKTCGFKVLFAFRDLWKDRDGIILMIGTGVFLLNHLTSSPRILPGRDEVFTTHWLNDCRQGAENLKQP